MNFVGLLRFSAASNVGFSIIYNVGKQSGIKESVGSI